MKIETKIQRNNLAAQEDDHIWIRFPELRKRLQTLDEGEKSYKLLNIHSKFRKAGRQMTVE